MPTFAMMGGNTVSNIIMADDKEATEAALNCTLIEYTTENPAGIGWTYDEETGKFSPPPPTPTPEEVDEKKKALMEKLGITEEELQLLLGD
jgi:hypothetical protein